MLKDWRHERNRLVSGVAVVKITGLDFHPRTKQRVENTESQFATAFDWTKGSFRFDRSYGGFGGQFISTPLGTVNRRLPDGSPIFGPIGGKMNDHVSAFDVRTLGIATEGEQSILSPTLDNVVKWFGTERKLEEIVRVADERYRIRWREQQQQLSVRYTVWLNRARGATPEEMQMQVRDPKEADWRLSNQIITEWTHMKGIYVPVRCEEARFTLEHGAARRSLTIEWKSVNEPVDARNFRADDLENILGARR
jgi:hypothetical protein